MMASKAKKQACWVLRTFQSREPILMLTLLKTLIYPLIEYGCQLWSPHKLGEIRQLEDVQRYFTRKIEGMTDKNYWERLKHLKLYSLERRRERYIIIYTWKVMYSKVPNIDGGNKIKPKWNDRTGIKCIIPPLNSRSKGRIGTLKENSFFIKGPKLFNCLPNEVRDFCDKLEDFKAKLDKYLVCVPDKPNLLGQEYSQVAASNSLIDRIEQMKRENGVAQRATLFLHEEMP